MCAHYALRGTGDRVRARRGQYAGALCALPIPGGNAEVALRAGRPARGWTPRSVLCRAAGTVLNRCRRHRALSMYYSDAFDRRTNRSLNTLYMIVHMMYDLKKVCFCI